MNPPGIEERVLRVLDAGLPEVDPDVLLELAPRVVAEVEHFYEPDSALTVKQLAKRLGVSEEYVYEHARELGGKKLTDSPKAPWRFDPERVPALAPESVGGTSVSAEPEAKIRRRRSRPRAAGGGLEVRGEAPR